MTPWRKENLFGLQPMLRLPHPSSRFWCEGQGGVPANWIGKIVGFILERIFRPKYEAPIGLKVRGGWPHLWLTYAFRNAWGCRCGWSRSSVTRNTGKPLATRGNPGGSAQVKSGIELTIGRKVSECYGDLSSTIEAYPFDSNQEKLRNVRGSAKKQELAMNPEFS